MKSFAGENEHLLTPDISSGELKNVSSSIEPTNIDLSDLTIRQFEVLHKFNKFEEDLTDYLYSNDIGSISQNDFSEVCIDELKYIDKSCIEYIHNSEKFNFPTNPMKVTYLKELEKIRADVLEYLVEENLIDISNSTFKSSSIKDLQYVTPEVSEFIPIKELKKSKIDFKDISLDNFIKIDIEIMEKLHKYNIGYINENDFTGKSTMTLSTLDDDVVRFLYNSGYIDEKQYLTLRL